jgi:festuclavine dehydrogenase
MSESDLAARFVSQGIPKQYAKILATLDIAVTQGIENRLNDVVLNMTGRLPTSFAKFVMENKAAWC